ncbi:MAG: Ig-like domain-containing protein [Syntrophomonadaceae bacterium]|jgi:uncharacterized protein YjdB
MRERPIKRLLIPLMAAFSALTFLFAIGNAHIRQGGGGAATSLQALSANKQELASGVAVYTPTTRTTIYTSGKTPDNSTASFYNSNPGALLGYYMVANTYQQLTLNSYNNIKVTKLTLSMREGWAGSARASLKYSVDGGDYQTVIPPNSSFADWYGSSSVFFVDITRLLDITISNSITFRIDTSAGYLYCQRYSVTWQEIPTPLEALEMHPESMSLYTGRTGVLSVTPVPSSADGSVTWSTSNDSIATVDQEGIVTAIAPGEAIITATSIIDPSIIATCTVTVTDALIYTKVDSMDKLRFGATYTIGSLGTKGMNLNETSIGQNHYIDEYDAEYTPDLNGIYVLDNTLKFVLEPGTLVNTFALKVVGTNKYLSASDGLPKPSPGYSQGVYLLTKKESFSSWNISFDADKNFAAIFQTHVNNNPRYLRYHSTSFHFNTYGLLSTNYEKDIELFVDESTMTPANEVACITDDILFGNGNGAQGICETVLPVLSWAIGAMTPEGQTAFLTSEDSDVHEAIERYEYIERWVNANQTNPIFTNVTTRHSLTFTLLLISLIVVGVFARNYIFSRKRKCQ